MINDNNKLVINLSEDLTVILEKISNCVKEDITINRTNLFEKSLLDTTIHLKYLRILYDVIAKINELKNEKETITNNLNNVRINQNISNTTENNIKNKIIETQRQRSRLTEIETEIKKLEVINNFLVNICQICSRLTFQIKNILEILKIDNI